GKRDVAAEPKRIELIDPGVIAHLHAAAVADRLELRPRKRIERPAFRTMPSSSLWTVERTLALAAVEACQVPARERHPHHTPAGENALVLGRVHRLVRLHVTFIALAIAVGVQNHRRPALRLLFVAGLVE